jgi:5-formyltetrahydrofolate cyclo-ligase
MGSDPGRDALRRVLLARRDNTSAEMLALASEEVRRRLRRWPRLHEAGSVGAYHSIGSEIRTGGIIQDILDSGKLLLLPAVLDGSGDSENTCGSMEFRTVRDERDLALGPYGILEPRARCTPAVPDVVLVPAVAVTPDGHRLGYGRGYYDAYLGAHRIPSMAAALEKQVVKRIPANPHDIPMDWVVTERRLFQV